MKHFFTFFLLITLFSLVGTSLLFSQSATFSVQGVLRDPSGRSVDDGNYAITFKLYTVSTGGAALWTENQANVQVTHGVFSAMLGSVTPLPTLGIALHYYIGFSVAGGSELIPRVELGRSFSALTSYSMVGDSNVFSGNGNVGIGVTNPTEKFEIKGNLKLNGANTAIKFNDGSTLNTGTAFLPAGVIVMWSGTIADIPTGWALCDGTQNTPNLKGKFIVGYDSGDADYNNIGDSGGLKNVTLTTNQIPSNSHTVNDPGHSHGYSVFHEISNDWKGGGDASPGNGTGGTTGATTSSVTTGITVSNTGGGQPFENRPPFYTLAFIMKK